MTTVQEILEEIDDCQLERAVWRQLEEFLTSLVPSDAEPHPKNAIRVEGSDRLVPHAMVERVLAEVSGRVIDFDESISKLGSKSLAGETRGRKKAKKAASKKRKRK